MSALPGESKMGQGSRQRSFMDPVPRLRIPARGITDWSSKGIYHRRPNESHFIKASGSAGGRKEEPCQRGRDDHRDRRSTTSIRNSTSSWSILHRGRFQRSAWTWSVQLTPIHRNASKRDGSQQDRCQSSKQNRRRSHEGIVINHRCRNTRHYLAF